MEVVVSWVSGLVNMVIPALIFLYLNDFIFLSNIYGGKDERSRLLRRDKLWRLIPVSPIGLFLILAVVLVASEMIISAFLIALGVMDFSDESAFIPKLSPSGGFLLDTDAVGNNDLLLLIFILAMIIAVPVLFLVIRRYCKIVGCTREMGVFVYMAVLFMYVTSTLITMPINDISPTAASLISTGSFIVMLLIFYLPSADKIQVMRQQENSGLLHQINILPIINFILLLILLGFEVMLDKNGYLDMVYYIIILAFAIILYAAAQLSYNIIFRHIEERTKIESLSKESLAAQEQVTLAFAEITEAKSGQTGQHIKRVSEYSRVLAQALNLPQAEVEKIRIASMMHDVGKLLIPPEILEKIGSLTDEEFAIMKTHVTIGENLLHNAPGEIMGVARVIAQQHHEWWNGHGYLGMSGEDIDLSARITAVADVYDALTSNRSYKRAWSSDQAYEMILGESGEHFDPKVVQAFAMHFDEIKALQEIYKDEIKSYGSVTSVLSERP